MHERTVKAEVVPTRRAARLPGWVKISLNLQLCRVLCQPPLEKTVVAPAGGAEALMCANANVTTLVSTQLQVDLADGRTEISQQKGRTLSQQKGRKC